MTRIIYATTNPGKLAEVSAYFATHNIRIESVQDLGIQVDDPEETGTTLGENAQIKVLAYGNALAEYALSNGERLIVLSDDTGLEIDGLGGEPGIHVRRWKDRVTRMSDQEIIDHALWRMRDLRGPQRSAQFKTVIAASLISADGRVPLPEFFVGRLQGRILEAYRGTMHEGFPFAGLFYADEWKKTLGESYALQGSAKLAHLSHRERAIDLAIPWMRKWILK